MGLVTSSDSPLHSNAREKYYTTKLYFIFHIVIQTFCYFTLKFLFIFQTYLQCHFLKQLLMYSHFQQILFGLNGRSIYCDGLFICTCSHFSESLQRKELVFFIFSALLLDTEPETKQALTKVLKDKCKSVRLAQVLFSV